MAVTTDAVEPPAAVAPTGGIATDPVAAPVRVATNPVSYHLPHPGGRDLAVLAVALGLIALLALAVVDRLRAG